MNKMSRTDCIEKVGKHIKLIRSQCFVWNNKTFEDVIVAEEKLIEIFGKKFVYKRYSLKEMQRREREQIGHFKRNWLLRN